jgi:hypothetical protein
MQVLLAVQILPPRPFARHKPTRGGSVENSGLI